MASRTSQALIPPVFIVVMVASLILPIGIFFGFFMQKKNQLNLLNEKHQALSKEFYEHLNKMRLTDKIKKRQQKYQKALIELKTRYCHNEQEANSILEKFLNNMEGSTEFKITRKKRTKRISKLTGFANEIECYMSGWSKTNGLTEMFSTISYFGHRCLRCMNKSCKLYGKPVVDAQGHFILTQKNCKICKKLLQLSIVPKFYYLEKFTLEAVPKKAGGKHTFSISLIVPIFKPNVQ